MFPCHTVRKFNFCKEFIMPYSTLTSKGQTTIPRKIRVYLGLNVGDKLEFIIDEDGKVILQLINVDVKELKNVLPRTKKKASIEDMNKAIRKRGAGL